MDEKTKGLVEEIKTNLVQLRYKRLAEGIIKELKNLSTNLEKSQASLMEKMQQSHSSHMSEMGQDQKDQAKQIVDLCNQMNQVSVNVSKVVKDSLSAIAAVKSPEELKTISNNLKDLKISFKEDTTRLAKELEGLPGAFLLGLRDIQLSIPEDKPLKETLKTISAFLSQFKLPSKANEPIPVRLSTGKDFYDVEQIINMGGGGGSPTTASRGLELAGYDFVAVAYPTTTREIYTFRAGGASGFEVAIVTVVYTDATKNNILTLEKK